MVRVVADASRRLAAAGCKLPQARAEVGSSEHEVEHEAGEHEHDRKGLEHHGQEGSIGDRASRISTNPTAAASAAYTATRVA